MTDLAVRGKYCWAQADVQWERKLPSFHWRCVFVFPLTSRQEFAYCVGDRRVWPKSRERHEPSPAASTEVFRLCFDVALKFNFSNLERPSTSAATGAPKRSINSSFLTSWSSITSCRSAAMMACTSSFPFGANFGNGDRMRDIGFTRLTHLPQVHFIGKAIRFLDEFKVAGDKYSESRFGECRDWRYQRRRKLCFCCGVGTTTFLVGKAGGSARAVMVGEGDLSSGKFILMYPCVPDRFTLWSDMRLVRDFFQHFQANFAVSDFTQGDNGWFVFRVHFAWLCNNWRAR